jgi:hypothetical protein
MQNRISSFPPLIDDQSEIIILGSIPGVKSLEKQQYYAHPRTNSGRLSLNCYMKNLPKIIERIETLKNIILPFGMSSIPAKEKEAWILKSEMKKPIRLQNCWKSIRMSKLFSVTVESLTKIYRSCWERITDCQSFYCLPQVRFIPFPLKRNLKTGRDTGFLKF